MGTYIVHVALAGACSSGCAPLDLRKAFFITNTDLDVDTNRNGLVDRLEDEEAEDAYSNDRGAIYAVNLDRDGSREDPVGRPLPDTILFDENGVLVHEEDPPVINSAADAQDIAPLVIQDFGYSAFPAGVRAFLVAPNGLDDITKINVFPKIAAGVQAIWGSTDETASEIDITKYVDPASLHYGGDPVTKAVTFGVEGLIFRNLGTPLHFDGFIDLVLELRDGTTVITSDRVRMKVAPWLATPVTATDVEVWAADIVRLVLLTMNKPFLYSADAEPGYFGLDATPTPLRTFRSVLDSVDGNQWAQDHIEFGYTEFPGGPPTEAVFRLPYPSGVSGSLPLWPHTKLLGPDSTIFGLGRSFSVGPGDFGGNLEVLPPTPSRKLGKIVVGDTVSDELFDFLVSQNVQSPFKVPVRWLRVGHIDEVFMFTSNPTTVVVADPMEAFGILQQIPAGLRGKSVFFDKGGTLPVEGPVTMDSTTATDTKLWTGLDHRGQSWKYVRIYDESATSSGAAGQVGRISDLKNGYIEVDRVWYTSTKIVKGSGAPVWFAQYMFTGPPPSQPGWHIGRLPKAGDRYVLVEDSQKWECFPPAPCSNDPDDRLPAIVTVTEILADTDLVLLNTSDAQGQIDLAKTALQAAAVGGAGTGDPLTFKKVPVIYVGRRSLTFSTARSAVAMTPGLANLQPIFGKPFFPRQFGARNASGQDLFERDVLQTFSPSDVKFVDDWDWYHVGTGEVHCGSVVRKEVPVIKWWQNQP